MADQDLSKHATGIKRCMGCGVAQPLDGFFKDKRRPDGLRSTCKQCANKYYKAWYHKRTGDIAAEREAVRSGHRAEIIYDEHVNGRICTACDKQKPLSEFWKHQNYKLGHQRQCKVCHASKRINRISENPEKYKKKSRKYWYKKTYGLSEETFVLLFDSQGRACRICRKPLSLEKGAYDGPYIDHDHTTGMVRGILCFKCNRGIACFDDDSDRLRAAITYLKNGRNQNGESS